MNKKYFNVGVSYKGHEMEELHTASVELKKAIIKEIEPIFTPTVKFLKRILGKMF